MTDPRLGPEKPERRRQKGFRAGSSVGMKLQDQIGHVMSCHVMSWYDVVAIMYIGIVLCMTMAYDTRD